MKKLAASKVLNIYKPVGTTPYQQVQKIKSLKKYKTKKIGYAGRLDPMAEGVMIYLVGEENKKAKSYQRLKKTYQSEFVFGVGTDTYDILGITNSTIATHQPSQSTIKKYIGNMARLQHQSYPPFSYIRTKGKPLFKWAREGKLNEVDIPSKNIKIHSIKLLSTRSTNSADLKKYIFNRINKVDGDFRQEEIKNSWTRYFSTNKKAKFKIYKFELCVSSGTYIRGIANKMGKELASQALALNIVRTRVGKYSINNSQRI